MRIVGPTMMKRPKLPEDVLEFFRATGAKGGRARAKRLSPEQRTEAAKKAVQAREAKRAAKTRLARKEQ